MKKKKKTLAQMIMVVEKNKRSVIFATKYLTRGENV